MNQLLKLNIKRNSSWLLVFLFFSCKSSKVVVYTPYKKRIPVVKITPKAKEIKIENPKSTLPNSTSSNSTPSNSTQNSVILEATTKVKVTNAMVLEYILRYKTIAKTDMTKFGIPASITIAQGILESGAGTGPLSVQANNHFGIKCTSDWTGASIRHDDDSLQECFRKYNEPFESYNDHSKFLVNRTRYAMLFKLEKSDYKGWANGLKNAGYATDVSYPSKLIGLIERYQLNQLDNEVLGNDFNQVIKNVEESEPKIGKVETTVTSSSETHIVEKGDTLYSLSKKYNISVDEIKQKNNITDTGISLGQTLIVK